MTDVPNKILFSWTDYGIFGFLLLSSSIIGVYFGCFTKKQRTTEEYLLGERKLKIVPIGCSLIATTISGFILLGAPAEVYSFGATFWLAGISMAIAIFIKVFIFLPVYFRMKLTTTYEYLEKRFDMKTRKFGSFLFMVLQILYLPVVVYIASMSFSLGSGISTNIITPIIFAICIFYTTIGGIKAVVWTDILQLLLMVVSMVAVLVIGINSVGGISAVWNNSLKGKRLDVFDFDPDPTKKNSFWAFVIGLSISWLLLSVQQAHVLKYLSLPSIYHARKAAVIFVIGWILINTFAILIGLTIYAKYADCDPKSNKQLQRNDQIVPYFIMDVGRNIPGLNGLFIAGIFSATLSTLSADLNSLGGSVYEDFLRPILNKKSSQKAATYYMKISVVIIGILLNFLVIMVEKFDGIVPLVISLSALPTGPLVGMFLLGMFSTRINEKGALYGGIISLLVSIYLCIMNKYYEMSGIILNPTKSFSTKGCPDYLNGTHISNITLSVPQSSTSIEQPLVIYRLSCYYYAPIGILVTIISGIIISCLSGHTNRQIDRDMLAYPLYSNRKNDKDDVVYELVQSKATNHF